MAHRSEEEPRGERFERSQMLLGERAVNRLETTHVAICGLGAVGSYAMEALARTGVGRLTLVDFDRIQLSNINRQLLALETTLGRRKCLVARDRVRLINPECRVDAKELFIDAETVGEVMSAQPDVVIDALDSLGPKVELLLATVESGLAVVSSMGAARRMDPTSVRVGDISETAVCPLARAVRKRLRRRGVDGGVRCVFSSEPLRGELGEAEAGFLPRGRDRRPMGSMATITGIFGLMVAHEVVRLLLGPLLPEGT